MRVIQNRDWNMQRGDGITPAHAGNTGWLVLGIGASQDHPRACG